VRPSRRVQAAEAEVCTLVALEIGVGSCCGRHSLRVECASSEYQHGTSLNIGFFHARLVPQGLRRDVRYSTRARDQCLFPVQGDMTSCGCLRLLLVMGAAVCGGKACDWLWTSNLGELCFSMLAWESTELK
jgi:hypothetical protein